MDEIRKIRILFPPVILILSLAVGDYFDPAKALRITTSWDILAGGAVLILASGYLIGSLTHLLFVLLGCMNGFRETNVNENSLKKILNLLGADKIESSFDQLYPVAAFDHAYIHKEVHSWIQRRWHACFTSTNCLVALIIAIIIGAIHHIRMSWGWGIFTLIFIIALIVHAKRAWDDVKNMVQFQAEGPFPPKAKETD
jgi:hypothetical protein